MSMYMQFFLRAGDKFYPIGTYSRSSAVYEMFEEALYDVWEKITPVTKELLERARCEVNTNIKGFEEEIKKYKLRIDDLFLMRGATLDERMDMRNEYADIMDDYSERIVQLKWVDAYIGVLEEMLDEAENTKYYDSIETIDKNEYIYVGIEVGIPTVDDIV